MSEWTAAAVWREIDRKDRLNTSYMLRLLLKADMFTLALPGREKDYRTLKDMAERLNVYDRSVLSANQTVYACALLHKHNFENSLAVIFRVIVRTGEEVLLDDADPKWRAALATGKELTGKVAEFAGKSYRRSANAASSEDYYHEVDATMGGLEKDRLFGEPPPPVEISETEAINSEWGMF